jgi:hypothetical protein
LKASPVGAAPTDARAGADIMGALVIMGITATATGPTVIMAMGVAGGTETGLAQEHRFSSRVESKPVVVSAKGFLHRINPLAERNPACVRLRGPGFFGPTAN